MLYKVILFFLISPATFAQTCDLYKDCKSFRKSEQVCIVPDNPDADPLALEKYGYQYVKCAGKQKFLIRNNADYLKIKDWSVATCTKIDRLVINGHGNESGMATGQFSTNNLGALADLKCLFNEDAKIELDGCNTGRGCRGQMFMQQIAQAVITTKGLIVAPTSYATGLLITPHFSINGRHRTLQYEAESKKENWGFSGIKFGEPNAVKQCLSEVEEAYKDFKDAESKLAPECFREDTDNLVKNMKLLKNAKSMGEVLEINYKPPRTIDLLDEIELASRSTRQCYQRSTGQQRTEWNNGVQ